MRKSWNTIDGLLVQGHRQKPIKQWLFDNQLLTNESYIAEGFSTYYFTIDPQLDSTLPEQIVPPVIKTNCGSSPSLYLFPEDHEECVEVVWSLENTKCDLNTISAR